MQPELVKAVRKRLRFVKRFLRKHHLMHLPYRHNAGYCVICERDVVFYEQGPWLRDDYLCNRCYSIPRNRALIHLLNRFFPSWRALSLHESSPGGPMSELLERSCRDYSSSHYYEDVPRGQTKGKHRSEDLSALTFPDASFDLFITSDVFEHVMNPRAAFAEIARVLKPGGAHVFSMPWYKTLATSVQRARVDDGQIVFLQPPVYHGNPISDEGSLVTYDWGRDFFDVIEEASGMTTTVHVEKDRKLGIDAEMLEVFVSRKLRS